MTLFHNRVLLYDFFKLKDYNKFSKSTYKCTVCTVYNIYCIQYKILQTLVRQVTKAWKAVGRGVKLKKRVNKETSQIFG